MIKRLYVDNFRCFVNFDIQFTPISLLLGYNGSGKSSLLDIILRLKKIITGECKVGELFLSSDLTRWQTSPLQTFELELEGNGGTYLYNLVIEQQIEQRLKWIKKETLRFDNKPLFDFIDKKVQLYHDDYAIGTSYSVDSPLSALASVSERKDNTKLIWFREHIGRVIVTAINPPLITSESAREETTPTRNMDNFASWYRFLSQDQGKIIDLTNELKKILPGFQSFKLSQAGEEHKVLQVGFTSPSSEDKLIYYKFDELSDGQKALIILNTLIRGVKGLEYTFFLDEPDNYLALSEIQPWLMDLTDVSDCDDTQFVIISHHPELIDYLGPSSGIWLERESNSPVRVKKGVNAGDMGLKLSEVIERGWNE